MKAALCTLVCCLTPFTASIAETCSARSPAHTVALLELYTSEGCSSCPPAEKFVNGLRAASGLGADRLVPLSLHVDYWDHIGWTDAFGRRAYTQRQRWLSGLANSRTIYTPEVFLAGRELRDWRGAVTAAVKRINQRPAQADIGISLGAAADGKLPFEVWATAMRRAHLFVALYENGLASDVKAGENRGARLQHEYVVRELIGPVALTVNADGSKPTFSRAVPLPPNSVANNLGIAAFVQTDQGDVLQAVALPVCRARPG